MVSLEGLCFTLSFLLTSEPREILASYKLLIKMEEGSWTLLLDPPLSFVQEKKWKKLSSLVEMTVNVPE